MVGYGNDKLTLQSIQIRIVTIGLIIGVVFVGFSGYLAYQYMEKTKAQRLEHLKQAVLIARNSISPILTQYHTQKISKIEALDQVRNLIRRMVYQDHMGKNYIFMSSYDGTMLVQPYEPQNEMANMWNLKDFYGIYIIRKLVDAAKSKNGYGYVSYHYKRPHQDKPEEKISFVVGIPELDSYIGTGQYMTDLRKGQQIYIISIVGLTLFLLILLSVLVRSFMKEVRKQNLMLHRENEFLKQAEEALRKSEERYRLLADNATDNIWILQLSDFTFSYISPSVEQLLGYTPNEFIGLKMEHHMTETSIQEVLDVISEELKIDLDDGIDAKRYRILELEVIRKDGLKIWTEMTASFLRSKDGKPDRVLGITRNITERKQLELKLRQAQKMEALGTLAGGIAHDFNNILSSIIGFTELTKLGLNDDEDSKSNLDEVLSAGLRARDLVKHILTFSRKADAQKEIIQIVPLIKECLRFLKASVPPNIEIRHHFKRIDTTVLSDPTQFHQILMNLFTNAAYAMKEKGGVLEVKLDSVNILQGDIHQIKEILPGKYVQLIIKDTGCGISKNLIEKIFEPFFTTKGRGEGTGMGLSMVYGIIKEMKGGITVHSEEGIGSTFQILIPEQISETQNSIDYGNVELKAGKGKILLVDDETSIIKWLSQVLVRLGYGASGFTNGLEAIEKFKQDPQSFDLIFTDLAMPQISGLELVKQIKEIRSDIPIVLCTGFSEGLTKEKIYALGISDMVMKPLIAGELAQIIANALDDKRRQE